MAAALKYVFYQVVGGGFFRPDLPAPVMLTAEALYAALLMLFVLALAKDAAGLVLRVCRLFGVSWRLPLTPGWRCGLLMLVSLSCGAWGTWQAVRVPDVRTVNVAIPKLPAELEGFTLAQLSDLHIGPVQKKAWLAEVVRRTNALSPDAVAITGDMIDGLPNALRGELTPLADLRPKYGVFGVTGNHEYYYDARGWIQEFQKLGVVMLNNEHRVLPGGLVLGGVPDSTAERFGGQGPDVEAAFVGAPDGVARTALSQAERQRHSRAGRGASALRAHARRSHILSGAAHRSVQRRLRQRPLFHAAGRTDLRQPGHGPVERLFLPPRRALGNHPLRLSPQGRLLSRTALPPALSDENAAKACRPRS